MSAEIGLSVCDSHFRKELIGLETSSGCGGFLYGLLDGTNTIRISSIARRCGSVAKPLCASRRKDSVLKDKKVLDSEMGQLFLEVVYFFS